MLSAIFVPLFVGAEQAGSAENEARENQFVLEPVLFLIPSNSPRNMKST